MVARGLSVRETEALVKHDLDKAQPGRVTKAAAKKDVHTRAAEEQLHLSLGTPVEIKRRGKGGTIAITFTNEAELQRLYEYLTERRPDGYGAIEALKPSSRLKSRDKEVASVR